MVNQLKMAMVEAIIAVPSKNSVPSTALSVRGMRPYSEKGYARTPSSTKRVNQILGQCSESQTLRLFWAKTGLQDEHRESPF
jgi:hypothetical protein